MIAAAMAPLAAGCAEFATVMYGVSDQLNAEQGYYYEDQHYSDRADGNCPAVVDYGRVNNQSYQRIRNIGSKPATYTLVWSSGYETVVYLDPGETSEFFYMTPSVFASSHRAECEAD